MALGKQDQWLYFAQIALIIVLHRCVGYLCKKFLKVPRVIGDIIGGCLLGPTIMGVEANSKLFSAPTRDLIMMNGQLGLIFTSMSAGAGFDYRLMKGKEIHIFAFSFLNHVIPVAFAGIAHAYLPNTAAWRGPNFNEGAYFMFLACIFASSALPMVFLILDDLKLFNDLSKFCIGWSCVCTIVIFAMLSVGTLLGDPTISFVIIPRNFGFILVIIVGLAILQRFWAVLDRHWNERRLVGTDKVLNVIVVVLLIAVGTFIIQYTFLLGAFLAGMFIPFNADLRKDVVDRVRWLTRWVLLPQFFVYVGLYLNLRVISGRDWGYLVGTIILTFVSKAFLVFPTKWFLKFSWADSLFISTLANCRGFNGLVIAAAGQASGVIGPTFYVFCISVSLFSSAAAGPVCRLLKPTGGNTVTSGTGTKDVNAKTEKELTAINLETLETPKEVDLTSDDVVVTPIPEPITGGSRATESTHTIDTEDGGAEPDLPEPVLHSILGEERRREVTYLWMDDVVNLLHCPVQGIATAQQLESKNHNKSSSTTTTDDRIFSGKEIVDWIMCHYHLPFRSTADGVGFDLLHRGLFQAVQPERGGRAFRSNSLDKLFNLTARPSFDDINTFYRLTSIKEDSRPVVLHSLPSSTVPSPGAEMGTRGRTERISVASNPASPKKELNS